MLLERVCLQLICRVWGKKKRRREKKFKKKSWQWSVFLRCSRKFLGFWRLSGYENAPGEQQVMGNKTIAGGDDSWSGRKTQGGPAAVRSWGQLDFYYPHPNS